MRRSPDLRPRIWDALVVIAVIALAVGIGLKTWGADHGGALTVVISVDGSETQRLPLGEDTRIIETDGAVLTVQMDDTGVWVAESDCPTQDCVHTGKITRGGQSIVCLPGRVSIQLVGGGDDGIDAVIG